MQATAPYARLRELVDGIKFAMVTTLDDAGMPRSRPLTTLDAPDDGEGTLWFMVAADSEVAREVAANPRMNLAYAEPDDQRYLSIVAEGTVLRDPARAKVLWTESAKVWFSGPDDPQLALLAVRPLAAEYWDAPSTKVGRALAFAKALATGDKSAVGEHRKIDLGGTGVTPGDDRKTTASKDHPDLVHGRGTHPGA
jgi:general stress protein 26